VSGAFAGLLDFDWPLAPGVHAAFTTRLGGVSAPPCESFNLAVHVNDDPASVAANRARLVRELALEHEPRWLSQVHGVQVLDLDAEPAAATPAVADAAVTRRAGAACVVMVADCLPVLFASRDGKHIGAAHAGWRGLASGVLENTVAALGVSGASLTAWCGPAISQTHFEVGEEVRAAFVDRDGDAARCFMANARGRWQADLFALAKRRLTALGITSIHGGDWCTFADTTRFYSHRRDGRGGRMAALIWKA
jgi:YfiH family protein